MHHYASCVVSGVRPRAHVCGNALRGALKSAARAPPQALAECPPVDRVGGALRAIAKPKRFTRTLETLGVSIEQYVMLRDHQALTPKIYRRLAQQKLWLTTLKDLVKIKDVPCEIWALTTQLSTPQLIAPPDTTHHVPRDDTQ